MATKEQEQHGWFWIALILLLLWWWWKRRRRRTTPRVVVDTFTPPPDTSGIVSESSGVGQGYATSQGYALGEASAQSMQRNVLAPETVDMFNAATFIGVEGGDSGWPLFDTWESAYRDTRGDLNNETVAAALAQLQARLTAYVAGQISHFPPYQTL
jgi:hypothetical protein